MSTQRLHSTAFRGGSPARYQAARRDLRLQAARLLDQPLAQVRIVPAALTLERAAGERWIGISQDMVDQHEWWVRHSPEVRFRLTITMRLPSS